MTRPDDRGWNRLSPWGIGTRVVRALPSLIPALIGVFFLGRTAGPTVIVIVGLVISVLVGLLPWLTTRWRVTDDQLELRHGLLRRVSATARRDRIRSVDVTAGPIERVLKLRKVEVGTGVGGKESALVLDPIPAALAEQLGHDLLRRSPVAADPETPVGDGAAAGPTPTVADEELARLQPAWLRFAPFSLTGFAVVAAGAGIGFRVVDEAGLRERGSEIAESWLVKILDLGAAVVVPGTIVLVLVLSTLISVLAYVFAFWGFRLVRRSDGALHTSRGLVSTVAATIERKRVRGVQVHEPVLMRIPGGAKLRAIATGTDRNPSLLPPAPRSEAIRVADDVLGRPGAIETDLGPHGPAALKRRRTRALLASGVPAAVLVALAVVAPGAWWLLPAVGAVVLVVLAVPLAQVRYRNLGTTVGADTVVLGAATVARTRTVLEFDGVIGFVTTETFFQRRARVLTLTVATAAGSFGAVDLAPARAAGTARVIEPEIVGPYLTPEGVADAPTGASAGTA
ncbi:Membrane-flanked domain protein OS=Tsukamurella paurometabola (strain ATCC 8368 / DSM / CCUG 35730 / CIP 100753 / JCM 10117 / KCTC 9821 / NBRC 16120 / NCIMB 702349 / NCTC 13040) OX=521096 GN=Tpau_1331 PE=4 SV=1 [Tsukamurella paurometabola]|uniref:Membrane-flanked domain protein n=1 Tax=Tsukamurella paurometabola (strain ATCC 8368 / DSM 20162 / CCUG 35730 / CIP 100753 / JCM 10117 / KCTC 9821 / NBRC 16120 / NCIMB 702349 / NCTC 13040) TaxID=521096 RepID=D5UWT8_TSUPD|nr:PH domain-containing protein [Tsukamurella paurometabola]ADG77960.1 membrane-flanked domain protein [Tsukamurella paurometabola DSM 20162]SUP29532.1 Bacterial membrane flanked domain [Tsukamurella paurometabola]